MIGHLKENLDNYKVWKPEYYSWILNFLKEQSQTKLFVWIDNMAEEIKFSLNPPQFYELSKKEQEDFQIVYFIK